MTYARPELLAEPEWLATVHDDPSVRIVDCGAPPAYNRAHIPGALPLGLQNFIKEPAEPGQAHGTHVLAPEPFAARMSEIGIGPETTVVCYDDDNARVSTRFWWVLRYYGHTNAKVLNGGWHRWLSEGYPTSFHRETVEPATFVAHPDPARIATLDGLRAACETDGTQVFDTRSPEEFRGENDRGNKRAGRVPRSRNLEWIRFVTADDRRTFLPAAELQSLIDEAGFTRDEPVITYCQGGIRAAHAAFTLELLGYDNVSVYDGSMAEWANRDDTPLVR